LFLDSDVGTFGLNMEQLSMRNVVK